MAMMATLGIATLSAQSGSIMFEEIRKIEIKINGEMAQMLENIPKEQKSVKALYFSPEATIYQKPKIAESAAPDAFEAQSSGVRIMMAEPNNKIYIDLANSTMIEQKEFMTRMFLIEDKVTPSAWKITGNQKVILDYPCMEATKTDTAGVITRAWFAASFPVKGGPVTFCDLPGMVLEVDVNDGRQVYLAQSVDMTPPESDIFKKPKEGKKVTREEFDTIVAEKMKEMSGGEGGGGTYIINIRK